MTNYGYETIGGSTFNFAGGWKHGSKFTIGTAVTIASISAYLRDSSPASSIQFAIYSDDGGEPLTRLGMTESISTSTSDPQWYTANFTTPLSLSAGTYWIIENDSGSGVDKYYDAGSSAQTAYNNSVLTDPFGSGITFQDWVMSIYLTTSGPPPPPPAPTPPATGETLVLTNSNGTLWCKPLKWKESQACTPAIRPLPLALSEYLDSDTYVLKPRTIEVELRLSDREKKVFESIYNYASVSGVSQYTDVYLYYDYGESDAYTWHYTAWIHDKKYNWEYSREAGRYVRWWYLTFTLDVLDFSGTNDTLPQYPLSTVTVDGETFDFVVNFERNDQHPPAKPEWVNQTEAVDSYIWNECVLDVAYTCRMTNSEKYYIDESLRAHTKVVWEDYIHNLFSISGGTNGVWISSVEAEYDSTNWVKPWKVTVLIQANNSEIESRNGDLELDSLAYPSGTNHLGILYLDELPNPQGLPSLQNVDVGVHILYFFLPSQALSFHDWDLFGGSGVIVLEEYTFDRESILTVLITDDCIIMPRYNMPVAPSTCVTIALDSTLTVGTDMNFGYININGVPQGDLERMVNGDFETGDDTGWTFVDGEISTDSPYSGTYCVRSVQSCATYSLDINQTFGSGIPVLAIDSFDVYIKRLSVANDIWVFFLTGGESGTSVQVVGLPLGSWKKVDLLALINANSITGNILGVEFYNDDTSTNFAIDDVTLISGCLPYDFVDAIVLGDSQTLDWIADPNYAGYTFDHWEVICGDITIDDVNSASTTFTMNSGTLGWIRAVLNVGDFAVTITTNIDNPCFETYLLFNSPTFLTQDTLFEQDHAVLHVVSTAGLSNGDIIYLTDDSGSWETPTIESIDSNTSLTINHNSNIYTVANHATITGPLYNSPTTFMEYYGVYTTSIATKSQAIVYTFDHWEFSGGVSVADIYSASTTLTITGNGVLIAVFTPTGSTWTLTLESAHLTNPSDTNAGIMKEYRTDGELQWIINPPPKTITSYFNFISVDWEAGTSGKVFDHWEVAGSVLHLYSNVFLLMGTGTIRAVYTDA